MNEGFWPKNLRAKVRILREKCFGEFREFCKRIKLKVFGENKVVFIGVWLVLLGEMGTVHFSSFLGVIYN